MEREIVKGENLLISIKSEKTLDEKFCFNMLRELPIKAGLTPYADPQISSFPNAQVATEKGLSGMIVMIESHCAFHWWPERDYTSITISSCKPIKLAVVIEFLGEIFGSSKVSWIRTDWPEIE